jgi:P-type Cu+ transporter
MPEPETLGSTSNEPVCGMEADLESPFRTTYEGREILFYSQHCLTKFTEDPGQYLESGKSETPAAPSPETAESAAGEYFTCPMHSDVKEPGAGK